MWKIDVLVMGLAFFDLRAIRRWGPAAIFVVMLMPVLAFALDNAFRAISC